MNLYIQAIIQRQLSSYIENFSEESNFGENSMIMSQCGLGGCSGDPQENPFLAWYLWHHYASDILSLWQEERDSGCDLWLHGSTLPKDKPFIFQQENKSGIFFVNFLWKDFL